MVSPVDDKEPLLINNNECHKETDLEMNMGVVSKETLYVECNNLEPPPNLY